MRERRGICAVLLTFCYGHLRKSHPLRKKRKSENISAMSGRRPECSARGDAFTRHDDRYSPSRVFRSLIISGVNALRLTGSARGHFRMREIKSSLILRCSRSEPRRRGSYVGTRPSGVSLSTVLLPHNDGGVEATGACPPRGTRSKSLPGLVSQTLMASCHHGSGPRGASTRISSVEAPGFSAGFIDFNATLESCTGHAPPRGYQMIRLSSVMKANPTSTSVNVVPLLKANNSALPPSPAVSTVSVA
jgi:hypothetical protein